MKTWSRRWLLFKRGLALVIRLYFLHISCDQVKRWQILADVQNEQAFHTAVTLSIVDCGPVMLQTVDPQSEFLIDAVLSAIQAVEFR
jgi:hypothetical protein